MIKSVLNSSIISFFYLLSAPVIHAMETKFNDVNGECTAMLGIVYSDIRTLESLFKKYEVADNDSLMAVISPEDLKQAGEAIKYPLFIHELRAEIYKAYEIELQGLYPASERPIFLKNSFYW